MSSQKEKRAIKHELSKTNASLSLSYYCNTFYVIEIHASFFLENYEMQMKKGVEFR